MNRWLRLVRAPAGLTAIGDTIAGAAASGRPLRSTAWTLPLASVALYWSGMALNDWSDRRRDAVERPERPIPAGEVRPHEALGAAIVLSAAGTLLAAAGGRGRLQVALPLVGAIWAYDLKLKSTPAAPLGMAVCRGLNVLLGAGTYRDKQVLVAAAAMAVHTAGVTLLAGGEVHGARRPVVAAATAATGISMALSQAGSARSARHRAGAGAFGLAYVLTVGGSQAAVLREPSARNAREATVAGIHGMIPLQAALIARSRWLGAATAVASVLPLARRLGRKVSPS
jgi:4-hydroxybenzoate polyprenyltransferase